MKFLILIFVVHFSISSFAEKGKVSEFKKCYQANFNKIPEKPQKEFLDSYLKFLESKSSKDGTNAIEKLIQLTSSDGKKIPITWISLFEGSIELCCADASSSCTESFGSVTLYNLYPLVKNGNQTAINLVLAYSAVANTDGADASGLKEYQALIKNKKKNILSFKSTYKKLLKKYPINWLE